MSDAGSWVLFIGRILFALNFAVVAGAGFHVAKGQMAVGYARQMGFPFPKGSSLARLNRQQNVPGQRLELNKCTPHAGS